MTPDRRPPTPAGAEAFKGNSARVDTVRNANIPTYKDIPVTREETAAARDYLLRAPNAQVLHRDLGNTAFIDVAVHDTVFSTDRPSHALGGIRIAPGGARLAPELGADMETKYLTLHTMFEAGGAPESVREAARHDGGKAVLWAEDATALQGDRRTQVMKNVGHFIHDLNGLYVPGGDIGTNGDDLLLISQTAGPAVDVSCRTGDIPNSEVTAIGVHHAFRALVDHKRETSSRPHLWNPNKLTATFQGLGNVGRPLLIDMLRTYPEMHFNVFETNQTQIEKTVEALRGNGFAREEIHGRVTIAEQPEDPTQLHRSLKESDVFIPNAGPYVVNQDTLVHMPEGSLYVGAANDIIPKSGYADDPDVLAYAKARKITGVASYQANCGGIAAIAIDDVGGTMKDAEKYMRGVYPLVRETLAEAQRRSITPEEVAADRAYRHFAQFVKAQNISI